MINHAAIVLSIFLICETDFICKYHAYNKFLNIMNLPSFSLLHLTKYTSLLQLVKMTILANLYNMILLLISNLLLHAKI